MSKVSVLIPARNEIHLAQTVEDVFAKATGDVEVIVTLDGLTQYLWPEDDPRLKVFLLGNPRGMRTAINVAAAQARGKYLLKLDAHSAIGQGFDEILQRDYYENNWVVTARRYDLDRQTWKPKGREPVDYFYLACPWNDPRYFVMQSCPWVTRTRELMEYPLDDQMTMHGGMWFMSAKHFERLGGLKEEGYGGFAGEPLEIGMKTWLSGGCMVVNKKTWYAHPRDNPTGYSVRSTRMIEGLIWGSHYWVENRWPERIHDFKWLIEKFWPLPTKQHHCRGEIHFWMEHYDQVV